MEVDDFIAPDFLRLSLRLHECAVAWRTQTIGHEPKPIYMVRKLTLMRKKPAKQRPSIPTTSILVPHGIVLGAAMHIAMCEGAGPCACGLLGQNTPAFGIAVCVGFTKETIVLLFWWDSRTVELRLGVAWRMGTPITELFLAFSFLYQLNQ